MLFSNRGHCCFLFSLSSLGENNMRVICQSLKMELYVFYVFMEVRACCGINREWQLQKEMCV